MIDPPPQPPADADPPVQAAAPPPPAIPPWIAALFRWSLPLFGSLRWLIILDAVAFAVAVHRLAEGMWFPSPGASLSRALVQATALGVFALTSHLLAHGHHGNGARSHGPRALHRPAFVLLACSAGALASFSAHQLLLGRCVIEPPEDDPPAVQSAAGPAADNEATEERTQGISGHAVLVPVSQPPQFRAILAGHDGQPMLAMADNPAGFRRAAASKPGQLLITQSLFFVFGLGTAIGLATAFAVSNRTFADAMEWRRGIIRAGKHPTRSRPDPAPKAAAHLLTTLLVRIFAPGPVVILVCLGLAASSVLRATGMISILSLHEFIQRPVRAIGLLLAIMVAEMVLAAMLRGRIAGARRPIAALLAVVLGAASLAGFLYIQNKCTIAGGKEHGRPVYRPLILPEQVCGEIRDLRKDLGPTPDLQWTAGYEEFLSEDPERFEDDCRYFSPHLLALSTCLLAAVVIVLIASSVAAFALLGDMFTAILAPTGDGVLTELVNWCIELLEEPLPEPDTAGHSTPDIGDREAPLIVTMPPDAGSLNAAAPDANKAAGPVS